MRHTIAAGLLIAGLSVAHAQTITPGIGGVAVTGQSGAGVYLPWGGGAVIGAPGVGSYNLSSGVYTSPFAWSQYSNPTAYNFNAGTFNYNTGLYGWNNGVVTAGYYGSPYYSTYYPSSGSYYYPSGTTYYPSDWGASYYYPSSSRVYYSTGYGGSWTTPVYYGNGRGRGRWR